MEELLVKEVEELERLGVICRVVPFPPAIYLVIPRDLCKDNISDNISNLKSIGIKVFSKVRGVNEYYNVNGCLLSRARKLTNDELYELAHRFLGTSEINYSKSIDDMMTNERTINAYTELSSNVTKEELEEVLDHITFIRLIRGKI